MNERLAEYLAGRDYEAMTKRLVEWVRDWFAANGPDSPAVIGISGGKDSSIVAALCREALGRDRVFGVMMPNGEQSDIHVSRDLIRTLDIPGGTVNIQNGYLGLKHAIETGLAPKRPDGDALGYGREPELFGLSRQAEINLGPRLRMATLYAVAQCMNGRVANTSNRSEAHVGYATRWGDSVGDFAPLRNLTVAEVRIVGRLLGLPARFVEKAPSDGLSGKTDEDALGFTYEALDTYLLTGVCDDPAVKQMIDRKHAANRFKLEPIPMFDPAEAFCAACDAK